jgi:quercetin dioxygenase-like cupin family protein
VRSLIAGVDAAGNSCILKEVPIPPREDMTGPSSRIDIFELRETPPPQRPPAKASYHETGIEPGHADFLILQMPPGIEHPMHHTDTLNFHTIVAGYLDVLLDDGPHRMETGDSLVLPGIDHGWKAGPDGCTMAILNLGSVRPI